MTSRRTVLHQLGAVAGALLLPPAARAQAAEAAPESLKSLAEKKGMRFGNALGNSGGAAYRELMARECNLIVCENATKWYALQPQPGPYRFAEADAAFAWAKSQGMALRGHTLIWQGERWMPKWVNSYDFGAQPKQAAERLLASHIQTVCEHFGKDIISYDVLNEAVDDKDGTLRSNVFHQHLGGIAAIDLAFRLAHEYAPHAQLVYNDFMGPEKYSTVHRAGVLNLLRALRKRGTPVHALGIQSHIGKGLKPADTAAGSEWRKFLDEVTAMDFDLLVTEFDVSDQDLPADFARRDAGVASMARDYLDLTLSYPRCRDMLLWGMADHVSWLQHWEKSRREDGLPQRCTPYDGALQAKPLRETIAQALRSMPQRAA